MKQIAIPAVLLAAVSACAAGELTLTFIDGETKKPTPCRLHLRNEKDRPQRAANMPFWHDHFVTPGKVKLKLPKGSYHFEIERGPEYLARNGYFVLENQSNDNQTIDLPPRACNLAEEGWWSGDLHIHRPTKEIELLMLADDLHVAGATTWSAKKNEWTGRTLPPQTVKRFDKNRYCELLVGESAGEGGTLLFHNVDKPLLASEPESNDAFSLLSAARENAEVWIDVGRPTAWDLPLWLASGRVDSIELCDDQFCRGAVADDNAGHPRDKKLMPGAAGVGRWTHEIYYHLLNCGLRIPPSAGSGSGEAANPVGYNRVYVWVDKDQFDYEAWWKGFRMGRAVVTNGPLIRPLANARVPGHVFQQPADETLVVEVFLTFTAPTSDTVSYFELIKNGRLAQSIRYEDIAKTGRFKPVEFDESGWFLIRAVTDVEETYRFATSAPWYVEMGDEPKRVSRRSAEFFLDWLEERVESLHADGHLSPAGEKAWSEAKAFWEKLVEEANAD
ncbi:MAG TPA: hypothetical protein VFI31_15670 [Pirellulales bacterium]|nr:hypothetical protein [Pirellulales bacterium]